MKATTEWFEDTAKNYEQLGFWEPKTLGQQLRMWAQQYQNREALVEGDSRLTYKELDSQVDELASGFIQMGIKKGDNVAVQLPNRISFVLTCFALFRIGALPILVLPAHREAELDGIFTLAKPVAYIIPTTFLGFDYTKMAQQLVKKHPSVKFVMTDGESDIGINLADISGTPAELDVPSYKDTALLLLSGGTTGTPKLIPRTHADYAYNAKAAATRCKLTPQSVYLAVLPIAHNFPLCCPGILGTLSAGGKVVLCQTTSGDEAFPLIEKERVTITALVPSIVHVWLEVLEWDTSNDLSSLEVLQVGGSMLDENLAKRVIHEMKCKLQQVFGMAEGLICCTSLDDPESVIISCQGRPLSDADEVRIVDEYGNDVEAGAYGELIVRGPYTISGYYRAPEQNRESFTPDGFYRSGDKARITPEGNFQIGGRIKEQINRAGEKIMPAEVEAYLRMHPDIKDAALITLPDPTLGEKSCAYVITDNQDITLADIHAFFHEKGVARYKMPDQIEFIDYWPLTSVGKVNKAKLKELATAPKSHATTCEVSYLEETIAFEGDVHLAASQIVEQGLYENYLLYENGDELSLGMGIHALLTVDEQHTTLAYDNQTIRFENNLLSATIDKAFASIPLKNWRAYGTVNFGMARYYQNLPLLSEAGRLIKLFIPEVEIRFTKGSILLRALREEKRNEFADLLRKLRENGIEDEKNALVQRVASQKLDVPEADTYGAEAYMQGVAEAVREIKEHKYHKVILSRKIPIHQELDMVASYIAGRRVNTPARSFLLSLDGLHVAGFSPETVVEVDSNGWVSTFPLAGTRSRGRNEDEGDKLKDELLNDPKEIAEHAVSVKLAFEELKSVCDSTTILLSDFMSVASRGTVQHIASRLKGKIKPEFNSWDAFRALFPAVTASGIPKKESIDAIGRLESEPRNLYSGCVMTFDSDGAMDAALVLRTIYQQNNSAWLHAGAGVVEMSLPTRELEETREKLSSFSRQLVVSSREAEKVKPV
ncbi:salicylate synthase [Brevibacillus laterosporus]|uniref:Salicylate synthase n=1 Tax=Brevibacillus laterosporus LMG 15441 TaxID=1042163 RepID=A0A075R9R7_BRELA|nr:salicylate synthase [Brevibacillus laterosporus]AIG28008.1 salicylate synthase [Brevibacillus laterosporus LMG 15441]RJL09703.1 salicylate synthase [Brevibacillus laterosporus]TPH14120.1 salicylate synthase [Brevibacillus laterosporus]